jgi:hypothetical protein
LVKNPTAVHDIGDPHETASSWLLLAPAGLGVRWIAQLVPAHCSARVAPASDPTAAQATVDAHDTPTRALLAATVGLGVGWIDQFAPFPSSANVPTVPAWLVENPTAAQKLRDVHETPSSPLPLAPAGFGVGWIDQLVPSRRCASVTSTSAPLVKNPTAVQESTREHEIPANWPYVPPAGLGLRWIDQLVPFHRSASITSLLGRPMWYQSPTAVHDRRDGHDTAMSRLLVAPLGVGVRWIDQARPFHRSAKVLSLPARLVEDPTAVQDRGDVHDTPRRPLSRAPTGFGVR